MLTVTRGSRSVLKGMDHTVGRCLLIRNLPVHKLICTDLCRVCSSCCGPCQRSHDARQISALLIWLSFFSLHRSPASLARALAGSAACWDGHEKKESSVPDSNRASAPWHPPSPSPSPTCLRRCPLCSWKPASYPAAPPLTSTCAATGTP